MGHGEGLIVEVEAAVEGGVQLPFGVIWRVGVQRAWVRDQAHAVAESFCSGGEFGAGVRQAGLDPGAFGLDGVLAIDDLAAVEHPVGRQIDQALLAGLELGELAGEVGVKFSGEVLLIDHCGV